MEADARPDLLNQRLAETFAELGATGPIVRAFLLRGRYYAGQRFRCGNIQAVLLAGKDEIEFYNPAGSLLTTVRVGSAEKAA